MVRIGHRFELMKCEAGTYDQSYVNTTRNSDSVPSILLVYVINLTSVIYVFRFAIIMISDESNGEVEAVNGYRCEADYEYGHNDMNNSLNRVD